MTFFNLSRFLKNLLSLARFIHTIDPLIDFELEEYRELRHVRCIASCVEEILEVPMIVQIEEGILEIKSLLKILAYVQTP